MIRKATEKDTEEIWKIFNAVIQTQDTYVFRPETTRAEFEKHWMAEYMYTYVYEEENQILGTYVFKQNQLDLGNHVANASYMVHPEAQGKGIGFKMGKHSLTEAKSKGFLAMQFNIVVSTNLPAIKLWNKLGFEIIGTTPKAFRHGELGLVDAHIMYREL